MFVEYGHNFILAYIISLWEFLSSIPITRPPGDQPEAIKKLVDGLERGTKNKLPVRF